MIASSVYHRHCSHQSSKA